MNLNSTQLNATQLTQKSVERPLKVTGWRFRYSNNKTGPAAVNYLVAVDSAGFQKWPQTSQEIENA